MALVALDYLFLPPLYSLKLTDKFDLLRLAIFATCVITTIALFRWKAPPTELLLRSGQHVEDASDVYHWHFCFNSLAASLDDRGVFLLDARGNVASWSEGAQALLGYSAAGVCGRHLSSLYPAEALKDDEPGRALQQAAGTSKLEGVTWLVRSNGSRLQAKVVLTALNDPSILSRGRDADRCGRGTGQALRLPRRGLGTGATSAVRRSRNRRLRDFSGADERQF
jgi:PAS domain S-box-containing protein